MKYYESLLWKLGFWGNRNDGLALFYSSRQWRTLIYSRGCLWGSLFVTMNQQGISLLKVIKCIWVHQRYKYCSGHWHTQARLLKVLSSTEYVKKEQELIWLLVNCKETKLEMTSGTWKYILEEHTANHLFRIGWSLLVGSSDISFIIIYFKNVINFCLNEIFTGIDWKPLLVLHSLKYKYT